MIKLLVPTSTKKVHRSEVTLGTGTGGAGGGGAGERGVRGGGRPARKTEEAVNCSQNNQNVKAGTPKA